MPSIYDDFLVSEVSSRPSKYANGSGQHTEREYVGITCPNCHVRFAEIPADRVKTNKASACKAHLAVCPKYTPPAPKETDLAAELRKAREAHEAERAEAQRRHEELMAQLRDANGQLSSVEGQLRDANGQLCSVKSQLTDVEGQLSFKRQCLTDVREWGQLREPDNTLVPQLTCREQAVAAAHQTEVSRLKAENEVLRAAAKEKAPATVVARAAEAETKMAKADAKMARAEEEAEAKVAKMQHDWDAFRAAKYLEVGNANANASRAIDRADRLKRKIQLLVHPDKVPEEARPWATHMFQSLFPATKQ
jgi:hypothetical protein